MIPPFNGLHPGVYLIILGQLVIQEGNKSKLPALHVM